MQVTKHPWFTIGAWLAFPLWSMPLIWWLAYHPWPVLSFCGLLLLNVTLLFALAFLAALVVLIAGPFVALRRSSRARALRAVGLSIMVIVSTVAGLRLGRMAWRDRVGTVVARGQPIVAAIDTFTAAHGRPPATLDELVPIYLPALPTTGIGAHPQFCYDLNGPFARRSGNPWILRVNPPNPVMGFDILMYFPQHNYLANDYGGAIERIDDWAYVHE